jgi:hypothetical protein
MFLLPKQNRIFLKCREMEDAQEAYSQEDEVGGMNVHLGIEGTNSNGHGGGKDGDINLVETLRKL